MTSERQPRQVAALARTWLFVPGGRLDRFDKATRSGADEVIALVQFVAGDVDEDFEYPLVEGMV